MKAEGPDRAHQRGEPAPGEQRGAVGRERRIDRREIGEELGRGRVGRRIAVRRAGRNVADESIRGGRDARIDADQRLPVRLVGAVRIVVAGALRQSQQRRRRMHKTCRQRELRAERVDLLEVVRERDRSLRGDRVLERLGRHERIAVAVPADPRARTQHRRRSARSPRDGEALLEREAQPRNRDQEGIAVIGEAVLDLVLHLELREPDHRRLPEREHLTIETGFELGDLLGRELHAVAPLQEPHDLALAVEDALAAAPRSDAR